MSTQAPAPKKAVKATQPPEDSTWKRYSRHGEMPLSGAGSFALHALVIGLVIILGLFVFAHKDTPDLPLKVVKVVGGSGGHGNGTGTGVGDGSEKEDGGRAQGQEKDPEDQQPPPPKLETKELANVTAHMPESIKKDPDALRSIQARHPNAVGFAQVAKEAQDRLVTGLRKAGHGGNDPAGDGPGGKGDAGAQGGSKGPGANGQNGTEANIRIKRMLRWDIRFDRTTPAGYLAQLAALGAILGIPVDANRTAYRAIRDLKQRPAQVTDEDPMTLGLICWFDRTDPAAVAEIMRMLGVRTQTIGFVVFFPVELEQQFLEAEKKYRNLEEDRIERTTFRLKRSGNRYVPYVVAQTAK